jgi:predicted PurR-regulated permease PerM
MAAAENPLEPSGRDAAPASPGPAAAPREPGVAHTRPLMVGFFLVAGLVTALLLVIYRSFLHPLLWAAALATLVYPAHRRLLDLVGGRANLSAVLSTIALLLVLLGPSAAMLNALVGEARDLWPLLTSQLGTDVAARFATWVETSGLSRGVHLVLQVPAESGAAGLEERLRGLLETLAGSVLQGLRGVTLNAPGALLQAGLTLVIFFFFVREGPKWVRQLRQALPLEGAHADALLDTAARTVGAVFRGVVLTALAQAALATIGYLVVGAPVPVLLGFVTLVASLLPFVGAGVVWATTALGLWLTGHTGGAVALAIWGALVVSLADNFLKPYLIGRGSRMPTLWLFLAILGGLKTFGMLGLLVGPAALAVFIACWRIYAQRNPIKTHAAAPPPSA